MTNVNTDKIKVDNIWINSFNEGKIVCSAAIRFDELLNPKYVKGKKYRPFKNPHTTNVQFAPCQSPHKVKVSIINKNFVFFLSMLNLYVSGV